MQACAAMILALVQGDSCDGSCHGRVLDGCERMEFEPGVCSACRARRAVECVKAKLCRPCADVQGVCPFCEKQRARCGGKCEMRPCMAGGMCPPQGVPPDCRRCNARPSGCTDRAVCGECENRLSLCPACGLGRRQEPEFDFSGLPGHKRGKELEKTELLPGVRFFEIEHPQEHCKTCAESLRTVGVVEAGDGKPRAWIAKTEKELGDLFKRRKLKGKPEEVAMLVASLVQAQWIPIHGALDPDALDKVVVDRGKAVFRYKKSHAYWKLTVSLDKDGAFTGLAVEDTGERCK